MLRYVIMLLKESVDMENQHLKWICCTTTVVLDEVEALDDVTEHL